MKDGDIAGLAVFQDTCNEVIQLNENTVWAGQPKRNDNPAARTALSEVRKLIFEGRYFVAEKWLMPAGQLTELTHYFPY